MKTEHRPTDVITISRLKLNKLLSDQARLEALDAGGVDNFEWYADCLSDSEYDPDADFTKTFENGSSYG